MQDKNLFKSKTVWTGIAILAVGILQFYDVNLPYELIYSACAGLGLYGVRDAIGANKKK